MALLTADDVLNKKFQPTKFREGYDQDEVDDFLDEVVDIGRVADTGGEKPAQGRAKPTHDAIPVGGIIRPQAGMTQCGIHRPRWLHLGLLHDPRLRRQATPPPAGRATARGRSAVSKR